MSLTVRLNGSNYVSDKTRAAFEQALADGHKVQGAGSRHENGHKPPNGNGHNGGNGHDLGKPPTPSAEVLMQAAVQAAVANQVTTTQQEQTDMNKAPDYARLFESLERGLAQSYEHQTQTVRVHEQYLGYQSNYTALFAQLLQQQGAIFAAGHADPQQAALAAQVLESLSHSLACFHDLQAETLSVHKQFLSQQAEYSQAHVDILRQEQTLTSASGESHLANPGNGHGNGHGEVRAASHPIHHGEIRRVHGNGHNSHDSGLPGNGNGHGHVNPPILLPTLKLAKPAAAAPMPPRPASAKPALPVAEAGTLTIRPAEAPIQLAVATAKNESVQVETHVATASPPKPSSFDTSALTEALLAIVSEKTGYPADMLDLSMDMEADLGIDSIKRVEILGALQEHHPSLPKIEPQALAELRTLGQIVEHVRATLATPAPASTERHSEPSAASAPAPQSSTPAMVNAASGPDTGALTESLLAIVSEKTGYPADMLDLSMDMEADLGIDSIKRVEILGALQEHHPSLPKIEPQALAELRTLGQIVNYIQTGPDSKKV